MSRRIKKDDFSQLLDLLSEPMRSGIGARRTVIRKTKHRMLIEEGSPSTEVFFLREGHAEVRLYSSQDRGMVYVHTLGPGDMFGEIAVLDGQNRSVTVEAISDVVLYSISARDFQACIESSAAAALWVAKRLVSDVRRLTDKVFELTALNVSARVHCELLRLAERGIPCSEGVLVNDAPTHQALADHLGTSREVITRELGLLGKQGIVQYARRKLIIKNIKALEKASRR